MVGSSHARHTRCCYEVHTPEVENLPLNSTQTARHNVNTTNGCGITASSKCFKCAASNDAEEDLLLSGLTLPQDIMVHVINNCDVPGLMVLAACNKAYRELCRQRLLVLAKSIIEEGPVRGCILKCFCTNGPNLPYDLRHRMLHAWEKGALSEASTYDLLTVAKFRLWETLAAIVRLGDLESIEQLLGSELGGPYQAPLRGAIWTHLLTHMLETRTWHAPLIHALAATGLDVDAPCAYWEFGCDSELRKVYIPSLLNLSLMEACNRVRRTNRHGQHEPPPNGFVEVVQTLLEMGADPNKCDGTLSPLYILCQMKECGGANEGAYGSTVAHVAQLLVQYGADMNHRVTRTGEDRKEVTALMCASQHGLVRVVRVLLTAGADTWAKDSEGDTAMQYARKGPHSYTLEQHAIQQLIEVHNDVQ